MRKQRVNYSTQRLIQRSRMIIVKCRIWLQVTLQLTTKKKTCATIYFENLTPRHKAWVNFDFFACDNTLCNICECIQIPVHNANKYTPLHSQWSNCYQLLQILQKDYYWLCTYRTGWTMSSGLYDLITTAASLVQNTWDKSAPWRWEKKCIYNIQLEKKIKKMNGQNW